MNDLEFLKTHAPATAGPSEAVISEARAVLQARIDAAGAPHLAARPRRRAWRWVAVAAAAAASVALAGAFLLNGGPGRPDTAAAAALHKAAATALRQTSPALARGEYLYVKSEGLQLASAVLNRELINARVSQLREVWMGEHSVLRETTGAPQFVTPSDRTKWIAVGRPQIGASGTFTAPLTNLPVDLPSDANALFARLERKAQGHGTGLYSEMFVLVGDALRETATSPAQRAALYEVAARIPGVELIGNVTDAAGRPGVAVAMTDTANHTRQVLIFDPQTSQLLAEEATVTASNAFGWPAGTLMGRTTYLVSAVVPSNSALPSGQK